MKVVIFLLVWHPKKDPTTHKTQAKIKWEKSLGSGLVGVFSWQTKQQDQLFKGQRIHRCIERGTCLALNEVIGAAAFLPSRRFL